MFLPQVFANRSGRRIGPAALQRNHVVNHDVLICPNGLARPLSSTRDPGPQEIITGQHQAVSRLFASR
jgi:hypothetical protein